MRVSTFNNKYVLILLRQMVNSYIIVYFEELLLSNKKYEA